MTLYSNEQGPRSLHKNGNKTSMACSISLADRSRPSLRQVQDGLTLYQPLYMQLVISTRSRLSLSAWIEEVTINYEFASSRLRVGDTTHYTVTKSN